MKKYIVVAMLLLPSCAAADTITGRMGLIQPSTGSLSWGLKLNNSVFAVIDASAAIQGFPNTFTSTNGFTATVTFSTNVVITSSASVFGKVLVSTSVNAPGVNLWVNGGSDAGISDAGKWRFYASDNSNFSTINNNGGAGVSQLAFGTNSTAMTILAGGNVGVGSTNPSTTLHVNSSQAGNGIYISSTQTNASQIQIINDNGGQPRFMFPQGVTGTIGTVGDSIGSALTLKPGGNIGISSTTPTDNLSVGGSINVATGYKTNSLAGLASLSCTAGQAIGGAVVKGGIITGGSCAASGAGDIVSTATQTFSGANTFLSTSTFSGNMTNMNVATITFNASNQTTTSSNFVAITGSTLTLNNVTGGNIAIYSCTYTLSSSGGNTNIFIGPVIDSAAQITVSDQLVTASQKYTRSFTIATAPLSQGTHNFTLMLASAGGATATFYEAAPDAAMCYVHEIR